MVFLFKIIWHSDVTCVPLILCLQQKEIDFLLLLRVLGLFMKLVGFKFYDFRTHVPFILLPGFILTSRWEGGGGGGGGIKSQYINLLQLVALHSVTTEARKLTCERRWT